jgi:hypothetical protein
MNRETLIGEWDAQIHHDAFEGVQERAVFEPLGAFVVQRTTVNHPDFPDSVSIIGEDAMHYFDTRGVARVMTSKFEGRVWTLSREPQGERSDFWQRAFSELSEDGQTMEVRYENSNDGSTWELDFRATFTRVT